MIIRSVILISVVVLNIALDEEKGTIIDTARRTVSTLSKMMCFPKGQDKNLIIGLSFGRDRDELSKELMDALAGSGLSAVGNPEFTSKRLHGAIETNAFDFGVFDDVDAIVNGLARAHWQNLLATYPKAKLIVLLGDDTVRTNTFRESRVRLRKCLAIADYNYVSASESIAVWGSGCPSLIQIAKVEHQIVSEILENAPKNRTLIFDTRLPQEHSIASRSARIAHFVTDPTAAISSIATKWWRLGNNQQGYLLLGNDWSPNFSILRQQNIHQDKPPILIIALSTKTRKALASVFQLLAYNTSQVLTSYIATFDDQVNWYTDIPSKTTAFVCAPAFWYEFYQVLGPETKVVLALSQQEEYFSQEDYSSRIDLRYLGLTQNDWDNARATRENVKYNYRAPSAIRHTRLLSSESITRFSNMNCKQIDECRSKCHHFISQAREKGEFYTALARLSAIGDQHCHLSTKMLTNPTKNKNVAAEIIKKNGITGFDFIDHLVRIPSRLVISTRGGEQAQQRLNSNNRLLSRIPLYSSVCPSAITIKKNINNFNRHVLRVVPKNKYLSLIWQNQKL